jgi:hypothetical protein
VNEVKNPQEEENGYWAEVERRGYRGAAYEDETWQKTWPSVKVLNEELIDRLID